MVQRASDRGSGNTARSRGSDGSTKSQAATIARATTRTDQRPRRMPPAMPAAFLCSAEQNQPRVDPGWRPGDRRGASPRTGGPGEQVHLRPAARPSSGTDGWPARAGAGSAAVATRRQPLRGGRPSVEISPGGLGRSCSLSATIRPAWDAPGGAGPTDSTVAHLDRSRRLPFPAEDGGQRWTATVEDGTTLIDRTLSNPRGRRERLAPGREPVGSPRRPAGRTRRVALRADRARSRRAVAAGSPARGAIARRRPWRGDRHANRRCAKGDIIHRSVPTQSSTRLLITDLAQA